MISNINIKDLVKFYVFDKIKLPADLVEIPIGEWDVSNVTNMNALFEDYTNFNEDIGNWNVSKVTNMRDMFSYCYKFNQDIGNWEVSNVTNMNALFYNCRDFNQDISKWDVSKVTNMSDMFSYCYKFNQDISKWDVSKVTNMNRMFANCEDFDQDIGNWKVSKVTNMNALFYNCRNFNQDIGIWEVSNVTDMNEMFFDCPNFDQYIGNWDVSNVTNMILLFYSCRNFNQDIGNWKVNKVTNMSGMFANCEDFDQDIGNWKVSKVTNMNALFYNCRNFNQDIGIWEVSNVTDMNQMFSGCSNFNQDLSRWDIRKVTDDTLMFYYCPIIEAYKPVKKQVADSLVERAEKAFSGTLGGILEPLVIHPDDTFGNNNCTFGAMVKLLAPNISNSSVEIHTLSRSLNISLIFKTFLDCVGSDVINDDFNSSSTKTKLELSAILLYNLIFLNLSIHNADENADSWTHIYDNIDNTKKLVKHAIFNIDEGLMNHPQFDSNPKKLFYIVKFIELLPQQIQVAWAKFYIKEFIEGYGQELETFDPTITNRGFAASCTNGNFEKMLLSISTAITQFYPPGWGLEPVTDENEETEKQRVLKAAIIGSEFKKYYDTIADDPISDEATLEGYRTYIERLVNVELRDQYLNLLTDQDVVDKIEEQIGFVSGGGRFNKRNKTFKKKFKKTIKKEKLYKRKKTLKKYKLYKRKKNTRNKYNRKNSLIFNKKSR